MDRLNFPPINVRYYWCMLRAARFYSAGNPLVVSLLTLMGFIGMDYYLLIAEQRDQYIHLVHETNHLQEQYQLITHQLADFPKYYQQLQQMQKQLSIIRPLKYSHHEIPVFLNQISYLGTDCHLIVDSIMPKEPITHPLYVEIPIYLTLIGHYQQLILFLNRFVGMHHRLITIHDLEITQDNRVTRPHSHFNHTANHPSNIEKLSTKNRLRMTMFIKIYQVKICQLKMVDVSCKAPSCFQEHCFKSSLFHSSPWNQTIRHLGDNPKDLFRSIGDESSIPQRTDSSITGLRQYSSKSLEYVGLLKYSKISWALIKGPMNSGIIYKVSEGDVIGNDTVKVTHITDDHITLEKIVLIHLGTRIKKKFSLSLKKHHSTH